MRNPSLLALRKQWWIASHDTKLTATIAATRANPFLAGADSSASTFKSLRREKWCGEVGAGVYEAKRHCEDEEGP